MVSKAPTTSYSRMQIGLHWLIAALVLFQIVFGESMTAVVDAAEEGGAVTPKDAFLGSAHYWAGFSILALVALRLGYRVWLGTPTKTAVAPSWAEYAASAMHWLFYALLFAVPVLGLLTLYVSDQFGDIHVMAKPAFVVLVAGHAAAALYHHFVIKDGTLRRMLPGS